MQLESPESYRIYCLKFDDQGCYMQTIYLFVGLQLHRALHSHQQKPKTPVGLVTPPGKDSEAALTECRLTNAQVN